MTDGMNILITGASGFIGGHVAKFFTESGTRVYCLVRPGSRTSFIDNLPVTLKQGDICDPDSLKKHFTGMDAVVHTAGKVCDWGDYDDFYKVNVTGTLNVLKASLACGVKRVIITGSVSSYGEEDSAVLKDEASPYNPRYPYIFENHLPSAMNHYRVTKALLTREAIDFAGKNGMNLIVIEPVWVYGENERGTGFYDYVKTVAGGMPAMPGCRTNTLHVVYARELARAYYLACTGNLEGVHRIIIGNREPENMRHIYELFCREAGLKPPRILPKWLCFPVSLILEWAWTTAKSTSPPVITRSRVNMFYDNIGYNTKKAEQLLSFRNQVPLEVGIRNTVQWYKSNKWL